MSNPKKRDYDNTRREGAKKETREALIASALALFSEQGLDAPSIDEICARAGYSRGAFYAHFGDRNALMVEAMKSRRDDTIAGFLNALGDDVSIRGLLELLAKLVTAGAFPPKDGVRSAEFLQACRRSPELRRAQTTLLDATAHRLAEIVQQDQRAGEVRSDVDPAALSALLVILEAGVEVMADLGWKYDSTEVAQLTSRLIAPR
jgi:TetR/AcrR family transcriptional repressor of nem operon